MTAKKNNSDMNNSWDFRKVPFEISTIAGWRCVRCELSENGNAQNVWVSWRVFYLFDDITRSADKIHIWTWLVLAHIGRVLRRSSLSGSFGSSFAFELPLIWSVDDVIILVALCPSVNQLLYLNLLKLMMCTEQQPTSGKRYKSEIANYSSPSYTIINKSQAH